MSFVRWLASLVTVLKQPFLDVAEICDAWRAVPRAVLASYGFLCWRLSDWYMHLDKPSTEQTALVTAVIGLAVPLTAFYMQTGRTWTK